MSWNISDRMKTWTMSWPSRKNIILWRKIVKDTKKFSTIFAYFADESFSMRYGIIKVFVSNFYSKWNPSNLIWFHQNKAPFVIKGWLDWFFVLHSRTDLKWYLCKRQLKFLLLSINFSSAHEEYENELTLAIMYGFKSIWLVVITKQPIMERKTMNIHMRIFQIMAIILVD